MSATRGALKRGREAPDNGSVERPPRLERCPYDSTPIVADAYPGGFVVLSCERCGASWELHNSLVLRVSEPDWPAVEAARRALRVVAVEQPTA